MPVPAKTLNGYIFHLFKHVYLIVVVGLSAPTTPNVHIPSHMVSSIKQVASHLLHQLTDVLLRSHFDHDCHRPWIASEG